MEYAFLFTITAFIMKFSLVVKSIDGNGIGDNVNFLFKYPFGLNVAKLLYG